MNQNTPEMLWPPAYKLKKHSRAKHVKLRARKGGLEITIPMRFNEREVPVILEKNKAWIIKHLLNQPLPSEVDLPEQIQLFLTGECWRIQYMATNKKLEMIERPHSCEIVLVGKVENKKACMHKLINWLKQQSNFHLAVLLKKISEEIQLGYGRITVRDQLTRWGSCSSDKSISLNYKLLFLPAPLVRHVIIHELCHTKYLNHSEKFWALVGKHDALCEENKRALRRADKYIPGWVISAI